MSNEPGLAPSAAAIYRPPSGATLRWLLPGALAGVAFLAIAMAGSAITTTAWAMPDAIAAAVGAHVSGYGFQGWPVMLGIAVHLVVSITLGAGFTLIARWRRWWGSRLVVTAWLYAGIESAVSIWVVLHSVLPPAGFTFFLAAVPWWASVVGRNAYGLVLGLFLLRGPFAATWTPLSSALSST